MSASAHSTGALDQQQEHVTNTVTRLFSDLKREMDAIVNSSDLTTDPSAAVVAAAAAQQQSSSSPTAAGPMLRLSHGRTESEEPGYDDFELPHPLWKLPEALETLYIPSTELRKAQSAGSPTGSAGHTPTYSSTAAEATALLASTVAAAEQLVSSVRSSDSAAEPGPVHAAGNPVPAQSGLQEQLQYLQDFRHREDMLLTDPVLLPSACMAGAHDAADAIDVSAEQYGTQQGASRQLSYRELLDRALSWNPRVKGAGNVPASTSAHINSASSMRATLDAPRRSSIGPSAANSMRASADMARRSNSNNRQPRPSSTGRMPVAGHRSGNGIPCPPDYRARFQAMQQGAGQPGRYKFPGNGQRNSHFSLSEQQRSQQVWSGAAAVSSSSSRASRESVDRYGPPGVNRMGGALQAPERPKALHRSRSAPREEAAARRHIERMSGSPTRTAAVAASRESILDSQQQQMYGSWQRQQHLRQSGGNVRGSAAFASPSARKSTARSPDAQLPMRLTDDEWNSVSTRLHQYASGRSGQEGSPHSARHSRQRSSSTSPGPTGRGSASNRLAAAATAPPLAPDFYRRQNALLQKRAELAARRRRSSDDDMTECTFHPHINASSRSLQRSVQQLHAWDARRRLTVFAKALDKCEHECEGYTFTPTINPLSRQLALANYAVAPDPARPWTLETSPAASPRRSSPKRSPSPEAVRMLRDTLPPANVIMMAGPTAQQKAESVMGLLGGPAAAPAASTRHYSRSSASPVAEGEGSEAGQYAAWVNVKLAAHGSTSMIHEDDHHQEDHHQQQQQQGKERTDAEAGKDEAAGVVMGVPMRMPAMGLPVDLTAAGSNGKGGSNAQNEGSNNEGISVVGSEDGTFVIRVTSTGSQQSEKGEKAVVEDTRHAAAAGAAVSDGIARAAAKEQNGEVMEQQRLLAALKLTPAQAQAGLEEGHPACIDPSAAQQNSAAAAAARGSSSGGMAPGTPLFGSAGGVGSSGGNGPAVWKLAQHSPMRDDSAGGMYSASLAKKFSVDASGLSGTAGAPKAAGSPLSRAQQHEQQQQQTMTSSGKDVYSKDATLQDLAHQLGFSGEKAARQSRSAGLNTVPAFFCTKAEHRGGSPGLENVKRPSSYSQRYQKRLSNSAGGSTKQVVSQHDAAATSAQLPPELQDLMNSLTADGGSTAAMTIGSNGRHRRAGSSGGCYAGGSSGGGSGSPPASPTFEELKARWRAKETAASRDSSSAGLPRSGYSSPRKTSAGGLGTAGPFESGQGVGSGPGALSSSLVSGPETPMHQLHHQQLNPFATPAGLQKQYSTTQVLNAHARHSSSGSDRFSAGGAYNAAAESLAAATAALLMGGSDAAAAAAALLEGRKDTDGGTAAPAYQCSTEPPSGPLRIAVASLVPAAGPGTVAAADEDRVVVMLTNSSSSSSNGGLQTFQTLAACSSVISVPDVTAYGTAAAAAESCNGSSQSMVSEKAEVLLEGTRSVPFELVLSPRSKFLIANTCSRSSSGGGASAPMCIDVASPLGQHLLQLLLETGRMSDGGSQSGIVPTTALTLSRTQWQWLQQQYQEQEQQQEQQQMMHPCPSDTAAAAAAADPALGIPMVHSSCTVDAVTQLLSGAAAGDSRRASSGNGFTTSAAAVAAVAAACEVSACTPVWSTPKGSRDSLNDSQQQQQLVVTAFPSSSGGSSSNSDSGCQTAAAGTPAWQPDIRPSPQQQQQQQQADEGDLAAELAALLQSAGSMSPEEKAGAVARTFAKTISRLNMSSDVLQQTMAALDPNAACNGPSEGSSSTGATAEPAAAAAGGIMSDLDMSDMSDAETIQQLLERVSRGGLLTSPQGSPQQQQQQQQPSSPAPAAAAAAAAAAAVSAGGGGPCKSWASVVAAPRSSCP